MFDNVKALFRVKPASSIIEVSSAPAPGQLPEGFFRCIRASGMETLGYCGATWHAWEVGTVVNDGALGTVTLAAFLQQRKISRADLPIVNLNLRRQTAGVHQLGGINVVSTDGMPGEWNGEVSWDGGRISKGVEFA